MTEWTPSLVEECFAEAALVLKRLPAPRRQGYFNTWPEIVHSAADKVDQEPRPMRVVPSPAAISRMEETLSWTVGLEPVDGEVVWLRAHGERWKTICWTVGLQRSAAHQHWLYALCVIAWRLNRRKVPRLRSRRYVIEMVKGACEDPTSQPNQLLVRTLSV